MEGLDLSSCKDEVNIDQKNFLGEMGNDEESTSADGSSGERAGPSANNQRNVGRKLTQDLEKRMERMVRDAEKRGEERGENRLKRRIQEHVECRICLKVPKSGTQLLQCSNGHLNCDDCMKNCGDTCPTCRIPLDNNIKIRALAIEQIIDATDMERECRHQLCSFLAPREALSTHEKKCQHRSVPCPDYVCKQNVPFSGVIDHIEEAHGYAVHMDGLPFKETYFVTPNRQYQDAGTFVKFRGQQFLPVFVALKGVYYAWMYILGGSEEAAKYNAVMAVGRGQPSVIAHHGKIFPIDAKIEDILKEKSGVLSFSHGGMESKLFRDTDPDYIENGCDKKVSAYFDVVLSKAPRHLKLKGAYKWLEEWLDKSDGDTDGEE